MASIGCETLPIAVQLVTSLPGTLPGVKFHSLDYCHWLAMSELQARNANLLLPEGYLAALNKALDALAVAHHWEVVHHHGVTETAIVDIVQTLGKKVAYDPVIYWGVAQVGPRITFVYCRPVNIPPTFLPST